MQIGAKGDKWGNFIINQRNNFTPNQSQKFICNSCLTTPDYVLNHKQNNKLKHENLKKFGTYWPCIKKKETSNEKV